MRRLTRLLDEAYIQPMMRFNEFLKALRPDLLVFPFAQQEFDRAWRRRECLWRISNLFAMEGLECCGSS